MKVCTRCKKRRRLTSFHLSTREPDGHRARCKLCTSEVDKERRKTNPALYRARQQRYTSSHPDKSKEYRQANKVKAAEYHRNWHLTTTYGITAKEYDRLLRKQKGGCALCGKKPSGRALHVDHCHKTGKVRGLLCYTCNVFLGYLKDDPIAAVKIVAYLGKDGGRVVNRGIIDSLRQLLAS